jgi:HK97 family phage major capsid protein
MTLERENEETGERDYRVTDWEPFEISFVSVPFDPTVGVGRSMDLEPEPEKPEPTDPETAEPETPESEDTGTDESRALDSATEGTIKTPTPAIVTSETERKQTMSDLNKDDILKAERARVGAIRAMGVKFNLDEKMVERAIETDVDAMDFRADVLEVLSSRSAEETAPNDLDLSERDASRFSITRAIRANESNDWKGAEFELECSNEIAERTGEESRGFYLPIDIAVRAALATGAGAGLADASGIVATDTAADKFIKVLKSKAVLGRLGATYLPGLIGDLSIPKQSGTSTAYWLGEDGDVSDSDFLIGNVLLSPKTIAAAVPITRRLMKQDSLAVDSLIINDILGNIALGIDLAGIEGDGTSNTPLGLVNTLGVNTVTIAAAATTGVPTFAETVAFESAIDADDALEGSLAYLTTAPIAGGLKTSPLDAGSGRFILEQGQANGYSVVKSNQIAAKRIAFGDWTNLLIAMWGALDMRTDTSTKAKSDGVVLRGFQDVDVALRQAQGFAVNA